jgi:hypothetical protein
MQPQKRDYFLRRAAELELAANAATTPAIAEEYRDLARTFRELANETVGANGGKTGASDKPAAQRE